VGVVSFLRAGNRNKVEEHKGQPFIFVGRFPGVNPAFDNFSEYTRSYLTIRLVWYTPCAVRYERVSRFFKIFSVDMWICFALSLVLAVITVRCISNYAHKSHLRESKSYSNILSVTANIIASQYYSRLTVSVCKHTAPLCTATSVLLLLGVLQCCDQHSVPGVPHHISYRTRIRGTNQNRGANVKF